MHITNMCQSRLGGKVAAVALMVFALVAAMATPATGQTSGHSVTADGAKPSYVGEKVDTSIDPDGFLPNAAADPAPTCFVTDTDENFVSKWVDVISNCIGNYRVKAIVSFGPDSPCKYTLSGDDWRHRWYTPGNFDALVKC